MKDKFVAICKIISGYISAIVICIALYKFIQTKIQILNNPDEIWTISKMTINVVSFTLAITFFAVIVSVILERWKIAFKKMINFISKEIIGNKNDKE